MGVLVGVLVDQDRAATQRGRPPQVEHRVVGLAVVGAAQHRAGESLAQHLTVTQAQHGHHPAGVDRLRRADRNPLGAKRFHEPDQVAGQAVRGQRL